MEANGKNKGVAPGRRARLRDKEEAFTPESRRVATGILNNILFNTSEKGRKAGFLLRRACEMELGTMQYIACSSVVFALENNPVYGSVLPAVMEACGECSGAGATAYRAQRYLDEAYRREMGLKKNIAVDCVLYSMRENPRYGVRYAELEELWNNENSR